MIKPIEKPFTFDDMVNKINETVDAVNLMVPRIGVSTVSKEVINGYDTNLFSFKVTDSDEQYYKGVASSISKWLLEKSNEQVIMHLMLSSASSLVKLRDCIDSAIERLSKGAPTIPPLR